MEKVFLIDMNSLFATLFWGNAISFLFLLIYHIRGKYINRRPLLICLMIARACHAFYYFVAFGRGFLPDLLSVNAGNTLMLVGFYFEAQSILWIIKDRSKTNVRLMSIALLIAVICFNAVEFALGVSGFRIALASLGVVAIMALPVIRMLFSHDSSPFTKSTAFFYCVFLFCLLIRVGVGFQDHNMDILTTSVLQSLTFLTLFLQLMIALPSYALILKDYADEALLLMATTDRLTGATNRHAFLDAAAAIYSSCKRYKISVSVLFIDIDFFKQVNDQYGHAFGDAVLARLATLIDKCLRESDLSCRYGGEEFVVLLPRSDCSTAQLVAQRIVNEVRNTRFEEKPDFTFTISIGVSCGIPSSERGFDEAISAADDAMYKAKRLGRDRVVVYESGTGT